jgi:hypothetical protein
MKRFAMMLASVAVLSASTGCCCLFPWCGSSGACQQPYMQQQPCSPCSPYGSPYGAHERLLPGHVAQRRDLPRPNVRRRPVSGDGHRPHERPSDLLSTDCERKNEPTQWTISPVQPRPIGPGTTDRPPQSGSFSMTDAAASSRRNSVGHAIAAEPQNSLPSVPTGSLSLTSVGLRSFDESLQAPSCRRFASVASRLFLCAPHRIISR